MTESEFLVLPAEEQARILLEMSGCGDLSLEALWDRVAEADATAESALVRLRGGSGWQFCWGPAGDSAWRYGTSTCPSPLIAVGVAMLILKEELEDG